MEIINKGKEITVIFDDGAKLLIDKDKLDNFGKEPKKDRILNPDFSTISIVELPRLSFRDRAKLAEIADIGDDMVEALANDPSGVVRIVVACRDNLTDALKEKFVNDRYSHVRLAVAGRKDLLPNLIAQLIADENPMVRCRAISCQKLTDQQIRYLKENDADPQVQFLLESI